MIVSKEFTFEASHILPRHPGKCSRLHGHSWRLVVELYGRVSEQTGFVMDYATLKQLVQPIVDRLDHRHLNCFVNYPSSENLSLYIGHELWNKLEMVRAGIDERRSVERLVIRLSETQKTWAVWDSGDPVDLNKMLHEAYNAGWKKPVILGVTTGMELETVAARVKESFEAFQKLLTLYEQLRMQITGDD